MATEDGVIIACATTAEQNHAGWLHPMLDAAQANLDLAGIGSQIDVLLADAGYYSDDNITNAADGDPDLLIAPAAERKRRRAAAEGTQPDPETMARCSDVAQAMTDKLTSPEVEICTTSAGTSSRPCSGTPSTTADAVGFADKANRPATPNGR